ncbi:unnamed protein product [Anisakis simplex]|uniref:MSP domain-containing protein n=1 Tax=Anisakis simplex TaxID=6269 RepID=A0A0M3JE41_ANISI|nr:unnamed protein product [Anisakis simplex]
MLHYGLVFLALLSVSLAQPAIPVEPMILAKSCPYPNGTATATHTFNCDASHKIIVKSIKTLNSNGQPMYPIDMKKPIVLALEAQNEGDVVRDYVHIL